jgi:hypothetical protein
MLKHLINPFYSRLVFFAPDDGGGADPTETEKKAAADKAAAEAKAKEEQDALNKQFADRAKRAEEAKQKEILESLGVSTVEEAKALAEAARKAADANKTESERLQAEIKKANDAAAKAEADRKAALETANNKLLNSEIKISASAPIKDKDGKVTRPAFKKEALDDVLVLIARKEIKAKEDGEGFEGVEKALSELAKAKPWLLEEENETNPKRRNVLNNSNNRNNTKPSASPDDEPRTVHSGRSL